MKRFIVDESASDDNNLYVDITGVGTVAIALNDEGVVIDLFSLHVTDHSVASTWATYDELQ
tara:strand:- start:397 stop:579 length:183 start_codon:yes stop_codon:yes gene_type:complete